MRFSVEDNREGAPFSLGPLYSLIRRVKRQNPRARALGRLNLLRKERRAPRHRFHQFLTKCIMILRRKPIRNEFLSFNDVLWHSDCKELNLTVGLQTVGRLTFIFIDYSSIISSLLWNMRSARPDRVVQLCMLRGRYVRASKVLWTRGREQAFSLSRCGDRSIYEADKSVH